MSNEDAQEWVYDGHASATDANADLDGGQDGNRDEIPRGIGNINMSVERDPYDTGDCSAMSSSQSCVQTIASMGESVHENSQRCKEEDGDKASFAHSRKV